MLKIDLLNVKTKKIDTVTQDFISSRLVRRGLELQVEFKEGKKADLELLDEVIDFVVSVFDNPKVTTDTILDGLDGKYMWSILGNIVSQVVNGGNDTESDSGK
ncbi:phage tail assembly chaperone G [Listeria booriae]|uniref:phage tail assembly chaperone G n=1 Tax=Listeria booriae TaxID=1552123 RepID=UPI00162AF6A8|nr:hypothetical protein [Listeria booriae]MBC1801057.1 hypothetical protein [Listeria booriae]